MTHNPNTYKRCIHKGLCLLVVVLNILENKNCTFKLFCINGSCPFFILYWICINCWRYIKLRLIYLYHDLICIMYYVKFVIVMFLNISYSYSYYHIVLEIVSSMSQSISLVWVFTWSWAFSHCRIVKPLKLPWSKWQSKSIVGNVKSFSN